MSTEIAVIAVTIVGMCGTTLIFLATLVARLARLELKVDTMWGFSMNRAKGEAVRNNLGEMNSPIKINEDAKKYLNGLAKPLREFYRTLGRDMSDHDLALEIERRWGEQIVKEVCIPNGITQGECLLIAVAVAKGETAVM